jgi:hypothetical protein
LNIINLKNINKVRLAMMISHNKAVFLAERSPKKGEPYFVVERLKEKGTTGLQPKPFMFSESIYIGPAAVSERKV